MYIFPGLRHRRGNASLFHPSTEQPVLHAHSARGSATVGTAPSPEDSTGPGLSATVGVNSLVFTTPFTSLRQVYVHLNTYLMENISVVPG